MLKRSSKQIFSKMLKKKKKKGKWPIHSFMQPITQQTFINGTRCQEHPEASETGPSFGIFKVYRGEAQCCQRHAPPVWPCLSCWAWILTSVFSLSFQYLVDLAATEHSGSYHWLQLTRCFTHVISLKSWQQAGLRYPERALCTLELGTSAWRVLPRDLGPGGTAAPSHLLR